MADSNTKGFWHIDLMSVITIGVLVVGLVGGYTELKMHEQMTREGLSDVAREAKDFHGRMTDFVKREDKRAARQDQIDQDCPRHWHGKKGEIHYCGQAEPIFREEPPDDDPPADIQAVQRPKP